MQRAEIEAELARLTKKLGGGWRIEKGIMPVVVLTLIEAQGLEAKLDRSGDGQEGQNSGEGD